MFPIRKRKPLLFLTGFCLTLLWSGSTQTSIAAPTATLTLGTTVVSEGADFATRELAQPWDMNQAPYPDYPTMLKNFKRNKFSQSDGMYHLEGENNDPILWLLWTGIENTQTVLKLGDQHPIDASKYRLLSYYLCMDQVAPNYTWGSNAYWFYDRSSHDDPANGISTYMYWKTEGLFQTPNECNLIVFDLKKLETYNGAWNNSPRMPMGFRVDINNKVADYDVDWVRLTTRDLNNIVPMTWSGAASGTQKFYLSMDGCNQNGIRVGTDSGSSGTFNRGDQIQDLGKAKFPLPLPESFEPGDYYVYMKSANGSITCASDQITIKAVPRLEIVKPSRISGPDYATNVVNDPWGMSNSADFENIIGVGSVTYSNGIMKATTSQSDPRFFPQVTTAINTNKYKFASFHMFVEGEQSVVGGWVQRFHWWYVNVNDAVSTEDMVVYEGWNTYTIDLSTAPVVENGAWTGNPTTFRFDPLELPVPADVYVDFMLLTGDESVTKGTPFTILYNILKGAGATLNVYYDSDTNATNGRTTAMPYSSGPSTANWLSGVSAIFLPIIQMPNEIPLNGSSFIWDTSSVAKGDYYISLVLDDEFTTTTWYSEIPITIK